MFAVSHAASESAMRSQCYEVMPVAWVESPIVEVAQAPMQGDEGSATGLARLPTRHGRGHP